MFPYIYILPPEILDISLKHRLRMHIATLVIHYVGLKAIHFLKLALVLWK